MKLHSPEFEKRLRRAVRSEIRRSPQLRREARKGSGRRYGAQPLFRAILVVALGASVAGAVERTGHVATGAVLVNLWALFFTLTYAARVRSHLFEASDLPALGSLPLSESLVCTWELQRYVRSTCWLMADLAAGFASLAWSVGAGVPAIACIAPAVILCWAQAVATGLLIFAFLPRFPAGMLASLIMFAALGCLFAEDFVTKYVLPQLDSVAPNLNVILPSGWVVSGFLALLPGGDLAGLGLLALTGAVIWTVKLSARKLLADYRFEEFESPEVPDRLLETQTDLETTGNPDRPLRVGMTVLEEMISTREFLRPPSWPKTGGLEALFWGLLSSREKDLCDFVFPDGLALSVPWKRLYRDLLISAAAILTVNWAVPGLSVWAMVIGSLYCLPRLLLYFFNTGRAFEKVSDGGLRIPLYAGCAIGYRELSRVLLKLSWAQAPLLLPVAVIVTLLVSGVGLSSSSMAVIVALKATVLILASRYLYNTLKFSSCTNDTSGSHWRSLIVLAFILPPSLTFVGLGIAGIVLPRQDLAWLCLAGSVAVGWFVAAVYGFLYNSSRFDLVTRPAEEI